MTLQRVVAIRRFFMSDFSAKVAIPTDLIQEFIALLSDKANFDKWKAITLGLKVAQWLVETFAGSAVTLSANVPEGRVTKKKVAEALSAIVNIEQPVAKAAIPMWLLPVIIKLVIKWLAK
jgi:hypothetical protein